MGNYMSDNSLDLLKQTAQQFTDQSAYANAAAAGTNKGMNTASEAEQAVRTMNPRQILQQYGQQGAAMLDFAGPAAVRANRDQMVSRDLNQAAADSVTSAGLGVANSFGGVAAWGLGAISPNLGVMAAQDLNDLSKFAQGTQSPAMKAQRSLNQATTGLEMRDSEAQFKKDLEVDSSFVAGLKRIGRETMIGAKNMVTNPTLLSDGIASGVGSVVGAGVMAGGKAAMVPLTNMLSEGGSAYADTASKVADTKQSDLEKSPMYQEYKALGMTDPEIRVAMANMAGHIAGAITAPAAWATGKLTAGFEANPFAKRGVGAVLGNMAGESVEEGIVGGVQGAAGNVGIKGTANPNQNLTEGVGQQIGEGAIMGMGTAGAMQAPRLAATTAAQTGIKMIDAVVSRGEKVRADIAKQSPASNEKIAERVNAVNQAQTNPEVQQAVAQEVASATQGMDPAKAKSIQDYVDRIGGSFSFDPAVLPNVQLPETAKAAVSQDGDLLSVAKNLSSFISNESTDPKDKAETAVFLHNVINNMVDTVLYGNEIVSDIEGDHPIHKFLQEFWNLHADVMTSPAMKQVEEILKKQVEDNPPTINDNSLSQTDADQLVMQAETSPEKVDPKAAQIVLNHANKGSIELTPSQQSALNTSVALVQAAAKYHTDMAKNGQPVDAVGMEVQVASGMGSKGMSAAAYARQIYQDVRSGNLQSARDAMAKFGNFVQSQQNKLNALNSSYETGKPVSYQTVDFENDRGWFDAKPVAVHPTKENSVSLAQRIAAETAYLSDVYNGLVGAFPSMGSPSMPAADPLNASLQGKAADVAKAHTQPVQKTEPAQTPTETVAAKKQTPVKADNKLGDALQSAKAEMQAFDDAVAQTKAGGKQDVQSAPVAETPKSAEVTKPVEPAAKTEPVVETKQEDPTQQDSKSVVEPVSQEAIQAAQEEAKPEPDAPKAGLLSIFPNLVGGEKNRFVANFKFPENPISRLTGSEDAFKGILAAIGSSKAFSTFTGKTPSYLIDKEVTDGYRQLILDGRKVARTMINRFNERLDKKINSKANPEFNGKTFRELMIDGVDVSRYPNTRTLALANHVGGQVNYDSELLQQAILAGLSWLQSLGKMDAEIDVERAAKILDISESDVTADMLLFMNSGTLMLPAVESLTQKITKYFGVKAGKDSYIGATQGITEGMAKEVIQGLVGAGLLVRTEAKFSDAEGKPISLVTFKVKEGAIHEGVSSFPDALDELVLVEPEYTYYVGDLRPAVPTAVLHQPSVALTSSQKTAIANEQNTPNYLNLPMLAMFKAMGKDNILKLFAEGDLSKRQLNQNHRTSLEGRNLSFAAAFDEMLNVEAAMRNEADKSGKDLNDTEIFYAYNMTSVGRMQQLAKYGNQSSKLVREVVMPTRDVVDLNKPEIANAFTLGLAQALGIKVHKEPSIEVIRIKTQKLFDGPLKNSVDNFRAWVKSADLVNHDGMNNEFTDEQVNELLAGFKAGGIDNTPVAVMAVMEYARSLELDNSKFLTHLYVEADGVTNGVANAMMNYTVGAFSPAWIKVVNKSGIHFNNGPFTNNEQQAFDNKDIYKTVAEKFVEMLGDLRKYYQAMPAAQKHMDEVSKLMSTLFSDVYFDASGNLVVERGIAKNPVTITTYGSGVKGIGGNIAKAIMDDVYSRLSDYMEAKAKDPSVDAATAMFGKDSKTPAEAQQRFQDFARTFELLQTMQVKEKKDGTIYITRGAISSKEAMNPETYKVSADRVAVLEDNVTKFFAEPLANATNAVIGSATMGTLRTIQEITQAQSIYATAVFRKKIRELMNEKKAKDPDYNEVDFITQRELDEIRNSLGALGSIIKSKGQQFFIPGSQNSDIGLKNFSQDIFGAMSTAPSVFGPANAGVRAMPILNIGTGDGYAMQALANMEDGAVGSLKIFDGVNLKMSTVFEDSVKANEAVFASWVNNPLNGVVKALDDFANHFDIANMDSQGVEDLVFAFIGERISDVENENVLKILDTYKQILKSFAESAQARVNTIKRASMSIDQMAAAMSPFVKSGDPMTANNPDVQATELNKIYQEELAKINKSQEETKATEKSALEILVQGTEDPSGSRVSSLIQTLNQIGAGIGKELLGAMKALSNADLSDYKLVTGNADQVAKYASARGLSFPDLSSTAANGFINMSAQTVFLVNPTMETAVHESIHAATFNVVLEHYQGNTNPAVEGAIARLEALMEQFISLERDVAVQGRLVAPAYQQARQAMTDAALNYGATTPEGKAAALNEFMAWGLSNQNLKSLMENKQASKLARVAKEVWQAIKEVLFGKKQLPKALNDMYSNLLFNSAVIMNTQPSLVAQDSDVVLEHATPMLNELKDRLAVEVMTKVDAIAQQKAIIGSVDLTTAVQAAGFTLSQEEQSIFRTLAVALESGMPLDSGLMVRVGELHSHVMRTLKVSELGSNGQAKFDLLTGANNVSKDKMLSTFLGLAMVSDEFRAVLETKPLPKKQENKEGTLDAQLENLGNRVIDALSKALSGEKPSSNIKDSLDSLAARLNERVQENSTIAKQFDVAGSFIDKVNAKVSEAIGIAGDKLYAAGEKLEAIPNKYVKAAGKLAKLTTAITSDTRASAAAEGILATLNRTNAFEPLRTLVYDFIGSVDSNKDLFKLVKLVRTTVQQDRQNYRTEVPATIKKMLNVSKDQWTSLHTSLGKTDFASLFGSIGRADTSDILRSKDATAKIADLEADISSDKEGAIIIAKAKQLANYMMTGEAGGNLLRNADAIAHLLGEVAATRAPAMDLVHNIDALTTLYAYESLNQEHKDLLAKLMDEQANGIGFLLSYMEGQRKTEQDKLTPRSRFNAEKGHMPTLNTEGSNLTAAPDSQYQEMIEKGYERVGDYQGSNLAPNMGSHGYYFAAVGSRSAFRQGIMQVARNTAGGVDRNTGLSVNPLAGVITDPKTLSRIAARLKNESGSETFIPVYDDTGKLIAVQASMKADHLALRKPNTDLAEVVGAWRGRQVEEYQAAKINEVLVDKLFEQYDNGNPAEFVNVFATKDPVIRAAVNNITKDTRKYIENMFGSNELWVRRDMLNDVLGYHAASVGDVWSGNSRWSKQTQEAAKNVAIGLFGSKAYTWAINSERFLQTAVANAKTLIVVKSVVVPVGNIISNVFQLAMRGVPVAQIVRDVPKKIAEITAYDRGRVRVVELEARLRAAEGTGNKAMIQKIKAEISTITDGFKRLSIWPLIQRGEYSTVTDASTPGEAIPDGKLADWVEAMVDKLPPGVRTAGKYALIAKDTALFQGLQKSVQYGDFVAKSILFDDMIKRQKLDKELALDKISEEFVNYDRLPGRWRDGLESNGLMWFYNYKIRITKVALSILRNNPVHALLASGAAPYADFAGDVGLPTEDNLFTKLYDGKLGASLGWGMGLRAPGMNPWESLIN